MRNITTIQAHRSIKAISRPILFSTLILSLSTGYAEASYKIVQPIPSTTAQTVSGMRLAGSDIAYEVQTPSSSPATSSPPIIIQGKPRGQQPSLAAEPVVEGFADQVPLSVAMQQVLPQGMNYTLGEGVNPGQLVSWHGNRPWQTVLQDMLGPAGLTYSMNGQMVMVSNPNGAPSVISGAPPMPPPMTAQPLPMQAPPPMTAQAPPQPYVPLPPPPQNDMASAMPPPYQPGQPEMQPMAPMPPQAMPPQAMPPQASMPPQPVLMPDNGMPPPMPQAGMPPQAPTSMAGNQPLQIANPALFQSQAWEAKPGQTLRTTLQDWCSRVGAELDWQAEYDYPVKASLNMTGTFEEAVRTLLSGFNTAKPVPYGRLHYNPAAGQSILIVEASGNHYGD